MPEAGKYRGVWLIAPLLIGLVLSMVIGLMYFKGDEQVGFQNFALGPETKADFPSFNGENIHCLDIKGDVPMAAPPAMRCVRAWKETGEKPVILMLGNSQAHAINQMKPGDVPYSYLLHRYLDVMGYDAITFSQPNANLQEHYLLFTWLLDKVSVHSLVLPVVFNSTRETGIRAGLIDAFKDPFVSKQLSRTDIGQTLLAENTDESEGDLAGLKGTPQKRVESAITAWLDQHSELWNERTDMRGKLLTELFFFRNWLFDIKAGSKRKIIPGRYERNLAALKAILQSCAGRKIKVLVYIVPLRGDVETPYITSEYDHFKEDVIRLVRENGAVYGNLENLVPGDLWGSKDSTNLSGNKELDFMHFQEGGHELLAKALLNLLLQNHFVKSVQ